MPAWGGRRDDGVDFIERLAEIFGQQAAHLLRFQVIGIVVAGAERVCAEHDAALDLGAEAFIAGVAVHVRRVSESGER